MNIKDLNIKLGVLTTIVIGTVLMTAFHSVAMASPGGHCDHEQMSSEKMHEFMKARLEKLAGRLEIKSSQLASWEEFTKSVELLSERHAKEPKDDADAATVSRYRAERATELAKNLTTIADATAKLQTVLTEDQKKIFNQESHRFLHNRHGWSHQNRGWGHEGHEHEWEHGNADEGSPSKTN
ncbi:MAG: Spy/CpxP family protein refolding chaperone [Gallionella sp.]